MKLKLAAITLIISFLVALPYQVTFSAYDWRYDPAKYPAMVEWAGCTAEADVDPEDSVVNSYYVPGYHVIHIGAKDDPEIPYFAGLIILLHETGHCLQAQEGGLGSYSIEPKRFELDADRRSADLACGLGLDGRGLLRQTFQWAHDAFGYDGDENHGTLAQRISQGDLATACDKRVETWASISSH